MEKGPDIYQYTDHRLYIRDTFNHLKKTNPRFSYRFFNRICGMKSSSHLKLIMDGKKNLTPTQAYKVARGFKLSEEETHYLVCLAQFNQVTLHEEKDRILCQLLNLKKKSPATLSATLMEEAHYQMYSHWYSVVILELLRFSEAGKKNALWIQKRITPKISLTEIKQSLLVLKKLGLVLGNEKEGFSSPESKMTTPDLVHSVAVTNFHASMSEMASRSVKEDTFTEREFSALTIAVSEENWEKAKQEIRNFRKKLHSLLEEGESPRKRVVQINLQLFTLGKSLKN